MSTNKLHKKNSYASAITVIAGLGIIIATMIGFVGNQDTLVEERQHLADTVATLKIAIDSVRSDDENKTIVLGVVSDYFKYRNFQQKDSLFTVLADTLENYYLAQNASKLFVEDDLSRYWKKYPDSRYFIDAQSISAVKMDDGNYEATVNTYFTKNVKEITSVTSIIKVNADHKIYYLRDMFTN